MLVGLAVSLHVRERTHALLAIVLVAGSPVAYLALDAGHPEDVLAAAAATAGVLAAVRARATLSAVLLTVAVLAKQTAVLALLPAALALPKPKLRVLAAPVAAALLVYGGVHAPAARRRPHWRSPPARSSIPGRSGGRSASRRTRRGRPAGHGAITSPAWLAPIPHPLIVALALPLSVALVVARAVTTARARTRSRCSPCSRSSAACSTRGTSATTTCRWCSRSSRGRPRSAARR